MLLRARGLSVRSSVVLLGVTLAGCSGGEEDPFATAQDEIVYCPGPDVVQGIDVSIYQGDIDWFAVQGAGIGFAIARVSDGLSRDSKFDKNWKGMKDAGLVRGAYQFFEPAKDPAAQADLMVEKVGALGAGDLPCVLDVEVTGGQPVAAIVANIHTWIDRVKAATGKDPFLYTGKYFWKDSVASNPDFVANPLWLAAYVSPCPSTPEPWTSWAIWQYSSTGTVAGISGAVDLDQYRGSLAELNAMAGHGPSFAAKYVSQSFPLAAAPLVLTVNQRLPAFLELQNVGTSPWNGNTRLGTTEPRDRVSAFAAPDWLSVARPSGVQGTVLPGETYRFDFTWRAPDVAGTYFEHFGVVQEGVGWFSDAGQGGPKDDQLEAQIRVIAAEYQARVVDRSFPDAAEAPIALGRGASLDGWIELANVGTATWKAGEIKLAPTPRDQASPLAASSWLAPSRVSTLALDVAPGGVGHFPLTIRGGELGEHRYTFALIEEGVTWFADAPKGGGPDDDAIAVRVVVAAAVEASVEASASAQGSCACGVPADSAPSSGAWLSAAGVILLASRRRRRGGQRRIDAAG